MKIPQSPPELAKLLEQIDVADGRKVFAILASGRPVDARGRYLHWDEMRSRTPPDDLTHEEWWTATRLARNSIARTLPFRGTAGEPFQISNVDAIQEKVHRIDQQASGQIMADGLVTNLRSSDRYLVGSLVEEAITSSQLEGASTTRKVAKELLATGRRPRDRSEQMIVNNFQAMLFAQDLATRPLTPEAVLDLHRIVTDGTLDDPADAGRLQRPEDERIAVFWQDDTLLHQPPLADELSDRLEALCRFANEDLGEGFIHPVVRAIIVHFWMAYDHPFVDGNGRTARALFYWAMLRKGYWLAQYLSISAILRKAPTQYARSYLYTETDGNDLTYFVIYQLQVIERAITALHEYLARKIAETREIESLLHGSSLLNHRQLVVIRDALRDPSEPFTISAQARRHRVANESARADLRGLEELGLLSKQKVGKRFVFRSVPDLPHRLRHLSRA
jgi:Fic family protein